MPLLAWSAYTGSMTAMQLQLGLVGLLLIATVAPSPCSIVGSWTAKQDADLDGRSKEAEWNVVFGSDGTMNYTHSVQVQAVEEYWYNGEYIDDCMQTQAFSALYEFSDDDLDFQNAHDCWDNVTCGNLVLPSPRCPAGSPGDVLFAYNCESMFWEERSRQCLLQMHMCAQMTVVAMTNRT